MTQQLSDKEVFELFIESADLLLSSHFLQQAKSSGISTELSWSHGSVLQASRNGPDEEAVRALLLTVRFFCQDNEPISLRNMTSRIMSSNIDIEIKNAWTSSRDSLNAHFDTKPTMFGSGISRREIFKSFIYGLYAHSNPTHRRKIKSWKENPAIYEDIRAHFDVTLLNFINAVGILSQLCKQALK